MLLTELTEAVTTKLNLSPESWGAVGLEAKPVLDWASCLNKTDLQVLIVPDTNVYFLEQLRRSTSVTTTKTVVILIAKGFVGLDTENDVAPWNETKELINIREKISKYLIANPIEHLKLVDIEEVALDELEMDHRNFVAMTQASYQVIQCGS